MIELNIGNLEKEKERLKQDIGRISMLSSVSGPPAPITLNKAYRLYNTTKKFDEKLEEVENNNEQLKEELILLGMSFIFNLAKMKTPLDYKIYYYMQYAFWKMIVLGGLLVDFKLSAKLMAHSLSNIDEKVESLCIRDESINNQIKGSKTFKDKVKFLVEKYKKNKELIEINENTLAKEQREDIIIKFNDVPDLFLSIHNATINIKGIKKANDKFDFEIKIKDIYDFTDWKSKNDIYNGDNSIVRMFGNVLNNFGVVSMKYGVLKSFDVCICFELKDYEIK